MVWRTDPMDNDGAAISSLVHVPSLPGLPGGDGHAGYLITAAGQLLNLYECSASGGRGEASLQVCLTLKHYHPDYVISMMATFEGRPTSAPNTWTAACPPGTALFSASQHGSGSMLRCGNRGALACTLAP